MADDFNIPPFTGKTMEDAQRWLRDVQVKLNNALQKASANTGAFFVWDKGCLSVPTNTTIAGAEEIVFSSPFVGNCTLVVTGVGFEGDINVALNGTNLGTLSDADTSSEILYEIQSSDLIKSDGINDALNSFKIWSTSGDSGELRKLEVWRNFTKNEIDTAGTTADWGSVTGSGKPDDNADVTAEKSVLEPSLAQHRNLKITRASASTLTITADKVVVLNSSGDESITLSSVNETVDITASGADGLDTGSESSDTMYHIFIIYNGTTTASLLSASASSPTMPSGYTHKGYVGGIYNDASGDLLRIIQINNVAYVSGNFGQEVNNGNATSLTSFSITVPTTAKTWIGRIVATSDNPGGGNYAAVINLTPQNVVGTGIFVGLTEISTQFVFNHPVEMVNNSETLYYEIDQGGSGVDVDILTEGWKF